MTTSYEVIIIGGGPVGIALGIELGLNQVKTLILEKHENPLLSPRAQSLNERSMELCLRWGVVNRLRAQTLFPPDFPLQGVWCSNLNGITYATAASQEQFSENIVAEKALRLPLYLTENVLRERLKSMDSVTLLKNHSVQSVSQDEKLIKVTVHNKLQDTIDHYDAPYAMGCDGANSITRECLQIPFQNLAEKRRIINVLFESADLLAKIKVEKGFLYFLMENKTLALFGLVDYQRHIWYAQIFYPGDEQEITQININKLLEDISGLQFSTTILNQHFWDMQIKCAEHFATNNNVFLLGDAAHAFAPTGGLGLNTGFGDVTNLAWKLAAVLRHQASPALLKTYEIERRPVCLNNLNAAEKNAADATAVRVKFSADKEPQQFALESAKLAKQHTQAGGLTMGYTYDPQALPMKHGEYLPTVKLGYFLPHKLIDDQAIYGKLSATQWTLIICGKEKIKWQLPILKILHIPENTYPSRYILIRPDWHIALLGESLTENDITNYLNKVYREGLITYS